MNLLTSEQMIIYSVLDELICAPFYPCTSKDLEKEVKYKQIIVSMVSKEVAYL